MTNFRGELLRDFHWSFDGRKLAMLRGHSESNALVIRDSKQLTRVRADRNAKNFHLVGLLKSVDLKGTVLLPGDR